jgi:DNA-dependent protein kinase catalytic subunit
MQPIIHMDNFIPSVCELATTSTDRKVKISASEFLHATTLYLIGTDKYSGAVWIEVCEKILLLGCDMDVTVQQMFEPLLLQICHYLSHPTRMLSNGSQIFLDSLICAITQNNNSNVRDLAGRCLREFLLWSVRQVSTDQSHHPSSSNLKIIFPKLKLLNFDSDANQRAGAALIFNNTYRIIREDEELIDTYSLELFDKFCLNFIMSEEFDDDTMNNFNLEQTSMCLDHLMRIFLVRKSLFNKPSKDRLVPMNFGRRENDGGTLMHVQQFLFLQCGSKQLKYRKKCMSMFAKLALSFDGITGE